MLTAEADKGIRLVKNIADLALSGMLDSIDIVGIQHRGGEPLSSIPGGHGCEAGRAS